MGPSRKESRKPKKRARCASADAAITETCDQRFKVVMGEIDKQGARLEALETALVAVAMKLGLPM